ncbi:MAG TPA: hypothetical protein VI643_06035 [Planctomycetota bacterium]|nr:hypothetical protein [Planctomycetota bacterium]
MRSNRVSLLIACSVVAGCASVETAKKPLELGEFDSNVIKISWMRIAPIMEAEQTARGTKGTILRGEAEYSVVYSYGWLRKHGKRTREEHMKGVGAMMMGWSEEGIPDEHMRGFVAQMLRLGLTKLPVAGPELNPALIKQLRQLSQDPLRYYEWQWARIVVVQTEKANYVVMPYLFRNRKDLLDVYKPIDNYVFSFMTPLAPRVGMRVAEEHE